MTALSEELRAVMRRAGVGARTLEKLTGIPRTAIDNLCDDTGRQLRSWRPLIQIAKVLSLTRPEVDNLLMAAGYPPVIELAQGYVPQHPDRALLNPWLASVLSAPRQLRAPAPDFVGRDEIIEDLLYTLRAAATGEASIVIISGIAGVGKTDLAFLAAHEARDAFPDGQLVLNLRGTGVEPTSPAQLLRSVIHTFLPDTQTSDDLEELQRRYLALLSGRNVLLVLDDAASAAQVRPLVPPLGNALLVTSRQQFTLPGAGVVDLEELSAQDSVRLLVSICPRLTPGDAEVMASACGHVPLALRVAAGVLQDDRSLGLAAFLRDLSDRKQRLSRLRDPDDPQLDVAAVLTLGYAQLDPPVQAVFRRLGALEGDFGTELAAAVAAPEEGVGQDILGLLRRRNLLGFDPERRRWQMPDLARDMAESLLSRSGDRDATMWRYANATLLIAQETQRLFTSGSDRAADALVAFDSERAHLDAGQRWAVAKAATTAGDELQLDFSAATYSIGLLRLDLRHQMLPNAEHTLAAARRLGDREGIGVALSLNGRVLLELGEQERAVACFEERLAMARTDSDRAGEIRALGNLAAALSGMGRLRQSIEISEEQLALVKADGNVRAEAVAMSNIGRAYLSLGFPSHALSYSERALMLVGKSGDRYGEGVIQDNLGRIHLALGDATRAADHAQQALAIAVGMADQMRETDVRCTLANALAALGDVQAGFEHAQRSLAMARDSGTRRAVGIALMALAECYAAAGEEEQPVAAWEEALEVFSATHDKVGATECRRRLGEALSKRDSDYSVHLLRAAQEVEREIGHARWTKTQTGSYPKVVQGGPPIIKPNMVQPAG